MTGVRARLGVPTDWRQIGAYRQLVTRNISGFLSWQRRALLQGAVPREHQLGRLAQTLAANFSSKTGRRVIARYTTHWPCYAAAPRQFGLGVGSHDRNLGG